MFGNQHTFKQVSGGIAIAAALALIAVPVAGASTGSRTLGHKQACQSAPAGWTTLADDQGLPGLVPVAQTVCATSLDCSQTPGAATASPYAGWVFVVDDLGLPMLVPAGQSDAADRLCLQTAAAPAADPKTETPASAPAAPTLTSPYPGWVFVIDDNGVPYLEPIAHA